MKQGVDVHSVNIFFYLVKSDLFEFKELKVSYKKSLLLIIMEKGQLSTWLWP